MFVFDVTKCCDRRLAERPAPAKFAHAAADRPLVGDFRSVRAGGERGRPAQRRLAAVIGAGVCGFVVRGVGEAGKATMKCLRAESRGDVYCFFAAVRRAGVERRRRGRRAGRGMGRTGGWARYSCGGSRVRA